MKKGFTLIELLAVIVILAIIALIATPIVLSIIDDAKESALLRSVEHYLSGVEQSIMKKNLTIGGSFSPNVCEVQEDGNLLCDGKETLEVELSGEVPRVGTIIFNKGKITDIDLTLSNKRLIKNDKGEVIYFPCTLISGNKTTPGSKYECEVKPGVKYNFYVLSSEEDGTTNLIMDRNINSDGTPAIKAIKESEKDTNGGIYNFVAWINQGDYESVGGQNWDDELDNNAFGPVTAMNFLNNATKDWSNIPNLNIKYNDEGGNFINFEVTGKARLPYHIELNDVGCIDYYISCPEWIIDYLEVFNLQHIQNPIEGINGYWTFSSHESSSLKAWYLFSGFLDYIADVDAGIDVVYDDDRYGVRPVINIKL